MKLAAFQARFQSGVLDEQDGDLPDGDFLALLSPPTRAENIEALFAIYSDGYRLRMGEFLSADYPVLREALGDDVFSEVVRDYVAAHPSRARNARWVGAALPEFLRATAPYSRDVLACAIAAFEAALARAFDCADESPLPIDILGATPQEDWPSLRFTFHVSVALVRAPAAALAFHESVQRGETVEPAKAGPEGTEGEDVAILVWREELDVRYRPLDDLEAMALREALAGEPFGEICSLMAFARPEEPPEQLTLVAAEFLVNWFNSGLIVAAVP